MVVIVRVGNLCVAATAVVVIIIVVRVGSIVLLFIRGLDYMCWSCLRLFYGEVLFPRMERQKLN